MLYLAVTAVEKLKTLKPDVWLKIGIAVGAFVVAILLWRRIMRMNKIVAGVIVFVVTTDDCTTGGGTFTFGGGGKSTFGGGGGGSSGFSGSSGATSNVLRSS